MKKNFPLHQPGKTDARVVDAIKADVRRYVRRERRKPLPEGVDLWEMACAVGADQASAQPKLLADVSQAIDAVVATGVDSVYLEILAQPGMRPPRAAKNHAGLPPAPTTAAPEPATGDNGSAAEARL